MKITAQLLPPLFDGKYTPEIVRFVSDDNSQFFSHIDLLYPSDLLTKEEVRNNRNLRLELDQRLSTESAVNDANYKPVDLDLNILWREGCYSFRNGFQSDTVSIYDEFGHYAFDMPRTLFEEACMSVLDEIHTFVMIFILNDKNE